MDAYVPATIYVEPVAVGIGFYVVNRQVVHPCGKQGKMAAMQHVQVFYRHVLAIFQADGFVPHTVQPAFFAGQPFPVDGSGSADGDVFQPDAP